MTPQPWLDDGDVRLYHGDALEQLALMPSESVHCIVTSPPFWGLRDYGTPGQIGLEDTPDEWCARLVAVMREARRVLRNDGVAFVEIGDSYNAGISGSPNRSKPSDLDHGAWELNGSRRLDVAGLKVKDLVGAPWMLAFALRADGWYLRSEIIWSKPNPMPESVTDRPTKGHSTIFLLAKNARYFFDADAIREPNRPDVAGRNRGNGKAYDHRQTVDAGWSQTYEPNPAGRNARSVWSIATEPTPFAHFATFPTALVERCIKAGTSEHGACGECGAPWRRITERESVRSQYADKQLAGGKNESITGKHETPSFSNSHDSPQTTRITHLGWEPGCACIEQHRIPVPKGAKPEWSWLPAPRVPCRVLDPFMGSGTTALVARRLGRHAIGIELNAEYLEIAAQRLQQPTLWSQPV